MAFVIADRVRETTTTIGTGNLTLDGAVSKFRTFASVLSSSDTTYYSIVEQTGTAWEVGIGTFTSPATLARTTILSSSNGGSAVNFGAGTKDVFISLPASKTNTNDQPNVISVNSTSDALRITQTGTGKALVVEDSANPDSSPFVVDASGNVGIGTNVPGSLLEVSGQVDFTTVAASGFGARIRTPTGSATPGILQFTNNPVTQQWGYISAPAQNVLTFGGGSEYIRIDSSGNVGIGTSSPAGYRVRIVGASGSAQFRAGTDSGSYLEMNGYDSGAFYCVVAGSSVTAAVFGSQANIHTAFLTNNTERMRITAGGTLLVGTTTQRNGITLQHSDGATTYRPSNNAAFGVHHFNSDVGGTAALKSYVQCDGTYTNLSDQRFKTDITPARSYLGDLLKIQVVNYRWKDDDSAEKKLGVIAQQVEQVFPAMVKNVVGNTQTGETQKMIPHEVFVPMLITAIQELKAEFDAYKAAHP